MGVLGGVDIATGFLLALLGERPRLETEGRLLAASHALLARELLKLDLTSGEKHLEDRFQSLIIPLLHNQFSLRCSRIQKGYEEIQSYYFTEGLVVNHSLHQEVVSGLRSLAGRDEVLAECLNYFSLPKSTAEGKELSAGIIGEISAEDLDAARNHLPELSLAQITSQLISAGLSEAYAEPFAVSLQTGDWRGSINRIETVGKQAISKHGFLILHSLSTSWLLNIVSMGKTAQLEIYMGNTSIFEHFFRSLTE